MFYLYGDYMNKAVLVVGLLTYDSGKTTIAEALATEAISRGVYIGVSKPISSYNIWYQHDFFEESIKLGILVGEDVVRLHRAAKSREPMEIEGPVVGALAPPDPEALDWRISLYTDISSSVISQTILLRITRCLHTGKIYTTHFIINENLDRCIEPLRPLIHDFLKSISYVVDTIEVRDLAEILESKAPEYADECLNYICREHELTIIESYNDVASPTRISLLKPQVVVAVAPGKAAIYPGDMYRKAIEVLGEQIEPWRLNTRRIISILKPIGTVKIEVKGRRDRKFREELFDKILKNIEG